MSLALKGQICLSIFWQQGVSHGLGIVYPILSKVSYNLAASSIVGQTHTNQILHKRWPGFDEFCNFGLPHWHPKIWVTSQKWLWTIVEHCDPTKTSNELGDPLAHYHWLSHPKITEKRLREGSKKQRFSATLRVQNLSIFPKSVMNKDPDSGWLWYL